MPLAAKVHHLRHSVDYKRGELELLPRRKEALVMFSAVLYDTNVQKGLHTRRNSSISIPDSVFPTRDKAQRHITQAIVQIAQCTVDEDIIMRFSIFP